MVGIGFKIPTFFVHSTLNYMYVCIGLYMNLQFVRTWIPLGKNFSPHARNSGSATETWPTWPCVQKMEGPDSVTLAKRVCEQNAL